MILLYAQSQNDKQEKTSGLIPICIITGATILIGSMGTNVNTEKPAENSSNLNTLNDDSENISNSTFIHEINNEDATLNDKTPEKSTDTADTVTPLKHKRNLSLDSTTIASKAKELMEHSDSKIYTSTDKAPKIDNIRPEYITRNETDKLLDQINEHAFISSSIQHLSKRSEDTSKQVIIAGKAGIGKSAAIKRFAADAGYRYTIKFKYSSFDEERPELLNEDKSLKMKEFCKVCNDILRVNNLAKRDVLFIIDEACNIKCDEVFPIIKDLLNLVIIGNIGDDGSSIEQKELNELEQSLKKDQAKKERLQCYILPEIDENKKNEWKQKLISNIQGCDIFSFLKTNNVKQKEKILMKLFGEILTEQQYINNVPKYDNSMRCTLDEKDHIKMLARLRYWTAVAQLEDPTKKPQDILYDILVNSWAKFQSRTSKTKGEKARSRKLSSLPSSTVSKPDKPNSDTNASLPNIEMDVTKNRAIADNITSKGTPPFAIFAMTMILLLSHKSRNGTKWQNLGGKPTDKEATLKNLIDMILLDYPMQISHGTQDLVKFIKDAKNVHIIQNYHKRITGMSDNNK